jgi:hypothetical protein
MTKFIVEEVVVLLSILIQKQMFHTHNQAHRYIDPFQYRWPRLKLNRCSYRLVILQSKII